MTDMVITDDGQPAELRNAMTNTLITDDYIDSSAVEAAFRKVPREASGPGDLR